MVCDKKCVQKQSTTGKAFLSHVWLIYLCIFLTRMSFFKSFYCNLIIRVDSKSTFIQMSLIIEYWRE